MALFWLAQLMLGAWLIGVSYGKTEAEIRQYFLGLGLQCNLENPISPEAMSMLHSHVIPNNEKAKCLLACVYKKATWMDDKGSYDVATAITMADKNLSDADKAEKFKKILELCKKVNDETVSDGEKGCERAALLTSCLIENCPKMGLEIVV